MEIFLIFFGLIIRVINAIFTELWRDEVYVILTSKDNSLVDLLFQRHWDTAHPPLYFIFLHFWQKISIQPFFLRLPSLFLSFFILFLFYLIVKKIEKNNQIFHLVAIFLFSISHTQISLNMTVRSYPLVIFFSFLSLYLFFLLIEKKLEMNNWRSIFFILFYSLVNFFVFFSDYSGIWLLFSYGIFFIISFFLKSYFKFFSNRKIFFFILIFSASFCFFWLPFLLINLSNSFSLEQAITEAIRKIGFLNYYLEGHNIGFFSGFDFYNNIFFNKKLIDFIHLTILFFAFIGLFMIFFKKKLIGMLFLIIFFIPQLFSALFSIFFTGIFLGRNLWIVNIVVFIGLSYFLSWLGNKKFFKFLLYFFLVVIFFVFMTNFPKISFVDPPYDFLKLHKKLVAYNKQEKILFTFAPSFMFSHLEYYSLFYPLKNLTIYHLKKSKEQLNIANFVNKKLFFLDFLYTKKNGFIWTPQDFDYEKFFSCQTKRTDINYIFLIECQ